MISAPRKTQPRQLKKSKISNPYAWRQGQQLWSLFSGLWIFSAVIIGASYFLVHRQYSFFIEQAHLTFPRWAPYLEREEQIALMAAVGVLLVWSPLLFALCKRWTRQTFDPLIFFHQQINSLTVESVDKAKDPVLPIAEFHEFYQSYQNFFEEMRFNRIKDTEELRTLLKTDNVQILHAQIKRMLHQKEFEIGSNVIRMGSKPENKIDSNDLSVSPDGAEPRRRVS